MKFNLMTEVFDERTTKIVQMATPGADVKPMTMAQLSMQLLLSNSDKPAAADVKAKHYQLLTKILEAMEHRNGMVDLTLTEVGIIKGLADTNCPTLVHGRINEILENPLSSDRPEIVAS